MQSSACVRMTRNQRRKVIRAKVLDRYGWRCFYCGKDLETGGLSLDHVNPESAGGKWSEDNLVPACKDCNQEKGNRTLEEYRMLVWQKDQSGSVAVRIDMALIKDASVFTPIETLALRSIGDRIKRQIPPPIFAGERIYRDLAYIMAIECRGVSA